ncbi:cytochrome P450 [Streptomyces olivoreticuli]|uniref:cytochrome P450 n=1 Tax=Streptomyces olivoreticuli TaxID=68246 RepID=UPI002658DE4A|nr:cytochrome P450 [Streptomyces olivoreticuli]WKK24093.1 cytochrome P450 [Streptomyces olivoreticuli]
MDPPDHTRIRRMLTREFTVKRIQALRPRLVEIVTEQLDEMGQAGQPVDLMKQFALPIASLAVRELLGVPCEERAEFQRRSEIMLDTSLPVERRMENYHETLSYIGTLIPRYRENPGDGILGRLVREHAGDITDQELIGTSCFLLVGGHDATAHALGLGTLLLLQYPDQQAALWEDEGDVLRTAVEEILRYQSLIHTGTPRWATRDLVLSGQMIKAGDMIIPSLASANHDQDFLQGVPGFDVKRPVSRHLAFGHGIHQCLGQQLARTVLGISFPALLDRFPSLRLAIPERDLRYRTQGFVGGVVYLPVAW